MKYLGVKIFIMVLVVSSLGRKPVKIVDWNIIIGQLDLVDFYKILNLTAKYVFLRNMDVKEDIPVLSYKTHPTYLKIRNHIKYVLRSKWNYAEN